jgi:hypothetical protein
MDLTAAVLLAGLLLPSETSTQSALAQRGCMGEIYTAADRNTALWRELGEALRQAGVDRPVAAACYRGTGVWTGWVLTERRPNQRDLWAVVMRDGPVLRTLCVTSEDDGCRKYWNPERR